MLQQRLQKQIKASKGTANRSDFVLILLTVTLTVKTKNPRKFFTYKGDFIFQ